MVENGRLGNLHVSEQRSDCRGTKKRQRRSRQGDPKLANTYSAGFCAAGFAPLAEYMPWAESHIATICGGSCWPFTPVIFIEGIGAMRGGALPAASAADAASPAAVAAAELAAPPPLLGPPPAPPAPLPAAPAPPFFSVPFGATG